MSRRPALCLNLYINRHSILVVGTGDGADERVRRLIDAGGTPTRLTEDAWRAGSRPISEIVIAHSADDALNKEVALWGREVSALTYAHDQPAISDFSFPALSRRGPLSIAIATQGAAPALAAQIRRQLDGMLERSASVLDTITEELEQMRQTFPPGADRMKKLVATAKRLQLRGRFESSDDGTPE